MKRTLIAVTLALSTVTACSHSSPASPPVTPRAAPAGCLAAISLARDITGVMGNAMGDAAAYPEMVPQAAIAGMNQDTETLNQITEHLKALTQSTNTSGLELRELVVKFNDAAGSCK